MVRSGVVVVALLAISNVYGFAPSTSFGSLTNTRSITDVPAVFEAKSKRENTEEMEPDAGGKKRRWMKKLRQSKRNIAAAALMGLSLRTNMQPADASILSADASKVSLTVKVDTGAYLDNMRARKVAAATAPVPVVTETEKVESKSMVKPITAAAVVATGTGIAVALVPRKKEEEEEVKGTNGAEVEANGETNGATNGEVMDKDVSSEKMQEAQTYVQDILKEQNAVVSKDESPTEEVKVETETVEIKAEIETEEVKAEAETEQVKEETETEEAPIEIANEEPAPVKIVPVVLDAEVAQRKKEDEAKQRALLEARLKYMGKISGREDIIEASEERKKVLKDVKSMLQELKTKTQEEVMVERNGLKSIADEQGETLNEEEDEVPLKPVVLILDEAEREREAEAKEETEAQLMTRTIVSEENTPELSCSGEQEEDEKVHAELDTNHSGEMQIKHEVETKQKEVARLDHLADTIEEATSETETTEEIASELEEDEKVHAELGTNHSGEVQIKHEVETKQEEVARLDHLADTIEEAITETETTEEIASELHEIFNNINGHQDPEKPYFLDERVVREKRKAEAKQRALLEARLQYM